jgi:DNA (cytosine-5)-methyltransferase 1
MASELVLSLFPGIGLLDMAFEAEGFCVVRGPDLLWGGDVKRFHPPAGKFDGVIGGPPCQAFSRLRHLVEANGYQVAPNLIPEFERVVQESQPRWFLMENVPAAPEPNLPRWSPTSVLLNNRWCGGEQNRVRRFSFGVRSGILPRLHVAGVALESAEWRPAVLASGGTREVPIKPGGTGKVQKTANLIGDKSGAYLKRAIRDQGLPEGFLEHAPFTVAGKIRVVGNGVPLPLGRAVARAVREALDRAPRKEMGP